MRLHDRERGRGEGRKGQRERERERLVCCPLIDALPVDPCTCLDPGIEPQPWVSGGALSTEPGPAGSTASSQHPQEAWCLRGLLPQHLNWFTKRGPISRPPGPAPPQAGVSWRVPASGLRERPAAVPPQEDETAPLMAKGNELPPQPVLPAPFKGGGRGSGRSISRPRWAAAIHQHVVVRAH